MVWFLLQSVGNSIQIVLQFHMIGENQQLVTDEPVEFEK